MKNSPSPAKPNQLKEKYIVLGMDCDRRMLAFGTPSGRAFHGELSANNGKSVLERLYPDLSFTVLEVRSYIAEQPE